MKDVYLTVTDLHGRLLVRVTSHQTFSTSLGWRLAIRSVYMSEMKMIHGGGMLD